MGLGLGGFVADLTEEEISEIEEKGAEGAARFRAREWFDNAKDRVVSLDMVRPSFLTFPSYSTFP